MAVGRASGLNSAHATSFAGSLVAAGVRPHRPGKVRGGGRAGGAGGGGGEGWVNEGMTCGPGLELWWERPWALQTH